MFCSHSSQKLVHKNMLSCCADVFWKGRFLSFFPWGLYASACLALVFFPDEKSFISAFECLFPVCLGFNIHYTVYSVRTKVLIIYIEKKFYKHTNRRNYWARCYWTWPSDLDCGFKNIGEIVDRIDFYHRLTKCCLTCVSLSIGLLCGLSRIEKT